METVKKTLEMPSDTLKALEQLAKITGAEGGVPEVIQDALRVYEWAVYQQANGNVITAMPAHKEPTGARGWDFATPPGKSYGDPTHPIQRSNADVQVLDQLFDDKDADKAKRFFQVA